MNLAIIYLANVQISTATSIKMSLQSVPQLGVLLHGIVSMKEDKDPVIVNAQI